MKYSQCFLVATIIILSAHSRAEVVLDGSLGSRDEISGPRYDITADKGHISGNNLFHSFSKFSLIKGEEAVFSGPENIENILSRVTGDEISIIDGTITSSIDQADFYLLNPNGVIFGENAQLNVSGSFYSSTADFVEFEDDGRFETKNSAANQIFSSAAPSAFGFLDHEIGEIRIEGSELRLGKGKKLGLIGGDITISGPGYEKFQNRGQFDTISIPSGTLDIISVASNGKVPEHRHNEDSFEIVDSFEKLGNVSFNKNADVSVGGAPAGLISIFAENLFVKGSLLDAHNDGDIDNTSRAVNFNIKNTILFDVNDEGTEFPSSLQASSYGKGNAGDIFITSEELVFSGSAQFNAQIGSRVIEAEGNAGNIDINVQSLELNSNSHIDNMSFGGGNAGNTTIRTDNLKIDNQYGTHSKISASTHGEGNAGNITIVAKEISMTKGKHSDFATGIQAGIVNGSSTQKYAGSINIKTDKLLLENGTQISTSIDTGAGIAGNIDIEAQDIQLKGTDVGGTPSGLFTSNLDLGTAGNISIETNSLSIENEAIIAANSHGSGDAGDIVISAKYIKLEGSEKPQEDYKENRTAIQALTILGGADAGVIDITTDKLRLLQGGIISVATFGPGNGGEIRINAKEILVSGNVTMEDGFIRRSGVFAPTLEFGEFGELSTGDGGDLFVSSDSLTIQNGALVSVSSEAHGNGGELFINTNKLFLKSDGNITSESFLEGNSGNININSKHIAMEDSLVSTVANFGNAGDINVDVESMHLDNSYVATKVLTARGDGGDVNLNSKLIVQDNTSLINADAFEGKGGNVNINTGNFVSIRGSKVSASSELGIDGDIEVNQVKPDVQSAFISLGEQRHLDISLLKEKCGEVSKTESSFVIGDLLTAGNIPYAFQRSAYTLEEEFLSDPSLLATMDICINKI